MLESHPTHNKILIYCADGLKYLNCNLFFSGLDLLERLFFALTLD